MGDKRSFIMYAKWMKMIKNLPDASLADLMRAIAAYQLGEEYEIKDGGAFAIFQMIKDDFDEDRAKYEEVCRRNAENGKNGGRPKKATESETKEKKPTGIKENPEKPSGFLENPEKADIDNDLDNENDFDSYSGFKNEEPKGSKEVHSPAEPDTVSEIIGYLNSSCGFHYKTGTEKTRRLIKARLKEGFTLQDFMEVIDKKRDEWLGTEMEQYLRPETLFGTKFEGYLNQTRKRPKIRSVDVLAEMYRREVENEQEGDFADTWEDSQDVSQIL